MGEAKILHEDKIRCLSGVTADIPPSQGKNSAYSIDLLYYYIIDMYFRKESKRFVVLLHETNTHDLSTSF